MEALFVWVLRSKFVGRGASSAELSFGLQGMALIASQESDRMSSGLGGRRKGDRSSESLYGGRIDVPAESECLDL